MNVVDPLDLTALITPEPTTKEVHPEEIIPSHHPENTHDFAPIPDKAFRNMSDPIATALVVYVRALQGLANAYFSGDLRNIPGDLITVDATGRKYLRIVRNNGTQLSVICFVEKATGLIWKAAGWKAPEKNFSRGNICDLAGIGHDGWGHYH